MYEVIRWGSIVLMWIAVAVNLCSCALCMRTWKRCQKKENELDAELKYCNTMIAACTEFLEVAHKESEEVVNELG